jgi:hypothetical protein
LTQELETQVELRVGNSEHCSIPKLCLTELKAAGHTRPEKPEGVNSPYRKFPNKLLPLFFMDLASYDLYRPLNHLLYSPYNFIF